MTVHVQASALGCGCGGTRRRRTRGASRDVGRISNGRGHSSSRCIDEEAIGINAFLGFFSHELTTWEDADAPPRALRGPSRKTMVHGRTCNTPNTSSLLTCSPTHRSIPMPSVPNHLHHPFVANVCRLATSITSTLPPVPPVA